MQFAHMSASRLQTNTPEVKETYLVHKHPTHVIQLTQLLQSDTDTSILQPEADLSPFKHVVIEPTCTAPAGTKTRLQRCAASRVARSAGLWKVGSTGASASTAAVTVAKALASSRLCGNSTIAYVTPRD